MLLRHRKMEKAFKEIVMHRCSYIHSNCKGIWVTYAFEAQNQGD